MRAFMIKIGNFFFHHRNHLFPLIICALYMFAVPPSDLFSSPHLENIKDIAALCLAVTGLIIRGTVIGYVYIKRGGLNKRVYAENLVTEGMFALSRNPLYVGNILIYVGVFLMHGNPWVIAVGSAFYVFIYWCIVLAEESYLLAKFGEGYLAYCADTPRWFPKLSRFKEATAGMHFNFKRVILKDYPTIATTFIALILTEMYEFLSQPHHSYGRLFSMIGMVIACLLMAAVVRTLKKRKWLTEGVPV